MRSDWALSLELALSLSLILTLTLTLSRYNVQLESDAVAAEVAAQMRACLPSE